MKSIITTSIGIVISAVIIYAIVAIDRQHQRHLTEMRVQQMIDSILMSQQQYLDTLVDDGRAIQKALDSAAVPANLGKGRWVKIKP